MNEKTCQNPECNNSYPVRESYGHYCSKSCKYRHQGKKLLADLEHNHTRCASCGAKLKEIEKPQETHPDVFIGFQYKTKYAEMGEKNVVLEDKTIETTGTICAKCGTTDHKDDYLREFYFTDFVKAILRDLQEKYRIGKLDKEVNYKEVIKTLKEGYSLEYSLGKAFEE